MNIEKTFHTPNGTVKPKETAPKHLSDEEMEQQLKKIDFLALEKKLKVLWDIKKFQNIEGTREIDGIRTLAQLVINLKESLGSYDTIISDDASGRLIALLLRKLNDLKRKEGQSKPTQTFFLASGRSKNINGVDNLSPFIEKNASKFGKTLVVTEYIDSGESIMRIIRPLEKFKIDYKIATVSIFPHKVKNKKEEFNYPEILKNNLIYGNTSDDGLAFNDLMKFTGVYRNPDSGSPHPEILSPHLRKLYRSDINDARADIGTIAEEFKKLIID